MTDTIRRAGILLGVMLGVLFGVLSVWQWLEARELESKLTFANRVAQSWELSYNALSESYEERGFTVTDQASMIDSLEERNTALAEQVRDGTVITLQEQSTLLHTELVDPAEVERVDGRLEVAVDHTTDWPRSWLRVSGTVTVDPDSMEADSRLTVEGELWTNVALTRLQTGELRVDVWYDTDDLAAGEVNVIDNLNDPLRKRGPLVDLGTGTAIFGGVALGLGAALLLGGL